MKWSKLSTSELDLMGEMDKIKNLIAELYWYNCQSYATCSLIFGCNGQNKQIETELYG